MNLQNPDMKETQVMDERQEIIDFFSNMEVIHGTVFDDGRRWCGLCLAPRFMC